MQFNGRLKRTPQVCPKLPCLATSVSLHIPLQVCGVVRGYLDLSNSDYWNIVNSFIVNAVYIRPFFSKRYHNMSGTVVHLLARGHPRPCVRTPGTKPRGIMCLLVGVVAKVQAPHWVVCQRLVLGSSFCGCGCLI